jgi:NAD dependent epimerase/dehydratase
MKVLVTGAEGFIGSHLVEKLLDKGHEVTAFVLYNSFNNQGWIDTFSKEKKKKIKIFTGDIRDEKLVREAVKGSDVVFHLAALIGIPYSYHSPKSYVETNILGTLHLLQAARDFKVKKFIHTSTSEIYGTPKYLPIDELHPINAQSPYAASKVGADQIAMSFYYSYGTPVTIVRPFNTFGPRQSARAIIPTVILQILSGKKIIKLGNISTTREFNYIEDTVRGFISTINKKCTGETINLGNGKDFSIKQIVELISKEMGKNIKIVKDQKRVRPIKSEVLKLRCSNKKAVKILNWKPNYSGYSGLKKGIKKTIKWFSYFENKKIYKSDIYNI